MPIYLPSLANHLWQSTLFVVVVWLLSLVLRKNRAAVRHHLWVAASVKFLIPFSLLVEIGGYIEWPTVQIGTSRSLSIAMEAVNQTLQVSQRLLVPLVVAPTSQESRIPSLFFGMWICVFVASVAKWFVRWRRLRQIARQAIPLNLDIRIRVRCCSKAIEPGVFGVFRPVLLLPEGLTERLSPAEVQAVLDHEVCHLRRHDNMASAIHMLIEALFWFHPMVWWIKVRLLDEQERACDQEVLRLGTDPHTYAESILKICRFYVASPLLCVSGITRSNLKQRIEDIMQNRGAQKMNAGKMFLVALTTITVLAGPIACGIVKAGPLAGEVSAQNPNDPIILSDTHGYNFESYMKEITDRVRRSWYSAMPDSARKGQMGRAVVVFTILRDGTIQDIKLTTDSGAESLNQASIAAIESYRPFPSLPEDFRDDSRIVVQFTFLYNMR